MINEERTIKIRYTLSDDENKKRSDTVVRGVICGSEDDYTITYTEKSEDLGDTETVLHITGGHKVTVSRSGDFSSFIEIEKNVMHPSKHRTPYGFLSIDISGHHVKSEFGRCKLSFGYVSSADGEFLSKIEFKFDWR